MHRQVQDLTLALAFVTHIAQEVRAPRSDEKRSLREADQGRGRR